MAVSNPASMSSVYAEFGAPAGTPLSAFVRGGAWVPNTAANANVPASLPIRLSQLAGAVKYVPVSLSLSKSGGTFTCSGTSCPASANVNIAAAASVNGGSGSISYSWAFVSGDNSITPNSTVVQNPSFLATLRRNGTASAVWQCTASDGQTSDTKQITLTANYEWFDTV